MVTIHNIPKFAIDTAECPKVLKVVLRAQIRDLFKMRDLTQDITLSNKGLDSFIDSWWQHHRNILRAASIRPEFNWATLSLNFDENVHRPVNLFEASKDYLVLLARPTIENTRAFSSWGFDDSSLPDRPNSVYLGYFHNILYEFFALLFKYIIFEDKNVYEDTEFTAEDAYVSKDFTEILKAKMDEGFGEDHKPLFCQNLLAQDWFKEACNVENLPFNKLAQTIFANYSNLTSDVQRNLMNYFIDNTDLLKCAILKHIGATQIANDKGPLKTTLCNKLVKLYYDLLTALTYGTSGNPFTIDLSFDAAVARMKNDFRFQTHSPFKQRNADGEGFTLVNYGTFEQLFARLQENVKGCLTKQSFVVSFHPCDMITCSFGYNWSSCQAFVNEYDELPEGLADEYHLYEAYSGTYNRGNFQFASGNCFIAYIPYEQRKDIPQYLWAKLKRCLIWVGDNLDCMRQNYFYPGKPTDQETLALAKVIREYIQDVVAPFNFSNGTIDWKSFSSQFKYANQINDTNFDGINEIADSNSGGVRYDDPILRVAYLKTAKSRSYHYAKDFKSFDTGKITNSYGNNTPYSTRTTCIICGKTSSNLQHDKYCPTCARHLILHNDKYYHPTELIHIVQDGKEEYFDLTELDKLQDVVTVEDGTAVNFKEAFKVLMPSGYKYFKKLPDYVKQCKVCHEYFHQSFMVGDVCINHINTLLNDKDTSVSFGDVIQSFLDGNITFACNDSEALENLLNTINDKVKWISGKNAIDYIPSSAISKGKFLYCNNNKLQLTCQAKSAIVELSKLLERRED